MESMPPVLEETSVVVDGSGGALNKDGSAKRMRISGWTVPCPDSDVHRRPGDEYLRIEEERVWEEKSGLDMKKSWGTGQGRRRTLGQGRGGGRRQKEEHAGGRLALR